MYRKPDAQEIFFDIVEMVRAVRSNKHVEVFRGGMEKLNFAQIQVVHLLFDKGGASMGELAASAKVKMPTMTDTVAKLESAGYAKRVHSSGDRRKVIVGLTSRGKKLVEYNRKVAVDYIEKFLSKFSMVEKQIFIALIKRGKKILDERFGRE